MKKNINHSLFTALITFIVSFPLLGLSLVSVNGSLTIQGADNSTMIMIGVAISIVFIFQLYREKILHMLGMLPTPSLPFKQAYKNSSLEKRTTLKKFFMVGLILCVIIWPFMSSRGAIDLATLVLIYVMLGLGLNIVVGLAGLLDLGYVAFYAVGAYSYALLSEYFGLSFWVALPIGGMLAALFGFLLGFPVLRLRGDYLAIVTLGFGEIIRILLNNFTNLTGGPNGISDIPKPTLFGMEFGRRVKEEGNTLFHEVMGIAYSSSYKVIFLYILAVILVIFTLFVIHRLMRMPVGRAWEALREDEIACRSLGLNRTAIKLSAFTIGAAFAGFAGCFFAARQGFISPESFTFIESAIILAIVVLGGMGSQVGVILAAIAMTVLPELARGFDEYRMLMFGLMMVLMMIWRPQGLAPAQRPHMEIKNDA
ncbi:Branched-chain amino acid transport system permease protein livM [gamma proteobacterium IMCC1989]|nr:Branched-chain amino acid transport system permease protein livM [gamma proteobacterium IMCC1989]